jgi:beta-lactamase class A
MYVAKQKSSPFKAVLVFCALLLVIGVGYYKFARHSAANNTAPHIDTGLQQIVNTWGASQHVATSVDVVELTGGLRTANRNPDTAMTTASTYKIYVAYAVLHLVEQGKYAMNTHLKTGQTVSNALSKMIAQSDNNSAIALGTLIGWKTIDMLAAQAGARHTDLDNYDRWGNATLGEKHTTAADLATLLSALQGGSLLNTANTQLLIGLMKDQVWRERIPAGVPAGIAVASKPGWLPSVQNDAAIIYGPKSTYLLVIMTNGNATQPLADLSRQVYDYLEH